MKNQKQIQRVIEYSAKFPVVYVDLFCGAGGTAEGVLKAQVGKKKVCHVAIGVNHDPLAIRSSKANHRNTFFLNEDVRNADMHLIKHIVTEIRKINPGVIIILWASLECTNFSKAKGGLPRKQDSRTLAETLYELYNPVTDEFDLPGYVPVIDPDYIQIENVREFMAWGPLDENGKPVAMKNGRDYLRWVYKINDLGYNYDYKLINAADHGAHTSRLRYFACFAKKGLPIVFPEPSHDKLARHGLKKWKPVKEVLDFDNEGASIFVPGRIKSPKSFERVYAGLVRFVGNGNDEYIIKYMGNDATTGINNGKSVDEPASTIATSNRLGLVQAKRAFITKYYSGKPMSKNISVNGPAGSVTTIGNQALVQPCFLINYNHSSEANSINESAPTLMTRDKLGFVTAYYGKSLGAESVEQPASTITPRDRFALVQSKFFIDKQYGGGKDQQSVEQPAGSILKNDKHSLIEAQWLMDTQFDNVGTSLDEAAPTITANRKHFYLMNPQWGSNSNSSVEVPAPTLIARMDKAPPYLVTTDNGDLMIEVFEDDLPIVVKIKYFMAAHGIVDIRMRMLTVMELKLITGLPPKYILKGNQSDQKKFIGNAVVPVVAKRWIEALYERLVEMDIIKLAA